MKLLIDAGNTRIKWIAWSNGAIAAQGAHVYQKEQSIQLPETAWNQLAEPQRIIISSVAGADLDAELKAWVETHTKAPAEFVKSEPQACGVTNAYENSDRLGVDRWVALIGAHAQVNGTCCVIDCGTATTIDMLDETGQHLGGVIMPGADLMRTSLFTNTKRLGEERHGHPGIFGKSTAECVAGGTHFSAAFSIKGICEAMDADLGTISTRIIAGGAAPDLLPELGPEYQYRPNLVFEGLIEWSVHEQMRVG